MRLRTIGVFLLGLVLLGAGPASAQEKFGGLTGVVTDASSAPVPGATITAKNKESGKSRQAVTSADGSFRMLDLDPGRYVVTAQLAGFQKAEDDNVLILLGRNIEFSPKLEIGRASCRERVYVLV